ncbi:UNVERIFIED_CONTAM: cytochrome c, partial [Bacteroidetes bacterium 56_B9]
MHKLPFGAIIAAAGHIAIARAADDLRPRDPHVINFGREDYQQSCASCHGAKAEGAPNWQK